MSAVFMVSVEVPRVTSRIDGFSSRPSLRSITRVSRAQLPAHMVVVRGRGAWSWCGDFLEGMTASGQGYGPPAEVAPPAPPARRVDVEVTLWKGCYRRVRSCGNHTLSCGLA